MSNGRRDLGQGAWFALHHEWLARAEADELMSALRTELTWESRAVVLFGRRVLQPRLIAWSGELGYRYSGQTLPPRSAPPSLRKALERVVDSTGVRFNHVLCNRYRDGRDSMGLHADDEPELGPDPVVASLSLGRTRRFTVKSRRRGAPSFDLWLEHGSLLVMGGTFQRFFRHGLPKDPRVDGERISLTFRMLLGAPSQAG